MKKTLQLLLIVFTITIQGQNKIFSASSQYYNKVSSSWQNYSAGNYEYDSNNNVISATSFQWSTGLWENYFKTIFTYNANNKITERLDQVWNASTDSFENYNKELYLYSNGNLTEITYYEWISPNWDLLKKSVISYKSPNLPSVYLSYLWNGTQWVNDGRYTTTYNSNNKLIEYLDEKWLNLNWVKNGKALYSYDSNNKLVTNVIAFWNDVNTIWEERQKIDYLLDANGNRITTTYIGNINVKLEYSYDTSSLMSSFANPFKDRTGIDYLVEDHPHINKVIGFNEFTYNTVTSSYEQNGRSFYNYNSSIVLKVENFDLSSEKVSLFPNPSNNFIQVLGLTETENYEVYSILGAKVNVGTVRQNEKIDVQNLTNGLYFLKFSSGNTLKFIKE